MIAARLSPGAISESSSSHLPASEASQMAKPVMFPPGWLSRGTMPLATGSAAPAKTIGIVRVSRWRAAVARVPYGTMTSGCKRTNSCASDRDRHDAELGQMCAQCIDHLGTLAHHQIARAMLHQLPLGCGAVN